MEPLEQGSMRFGFHLSISGSIDRSVGRALELGCETFQIFTRNPRGWAYRPLEEEAGKRFREGVERSGLDPVFSHMPYLPNLASPRQEVYERSVESLKQELKRAEILGIPYLVTHLGSHLGAGKEEGRKRIVRALKEALQEVPNEVTVLLENTAGTRHSMGSSFEEIRETLDRVGEEGRLGACLDTCHAFAAGYDLGGERAVDETLEAWNREVGLHRLQLIHLNDSRGRLGSRRDRHEHIGLGKIGEDGFRAFLRHPAVQELPLIMETPVDERRDDCGNLEVVRRLSGGD
jgi:deoxyribonuclease-4